MGIADQVRIGTETDAISNAGVIRRGCQSAAAPIDDGKRRPGLDGCNARPLPSSEHRMGQSLSLKEGQVVDVADGHHVTLVEVGTGAVGGEIVGVRFKGSWFTRYGFWLD